MNLSECETAELPSGLCCTSLTLKCRELSSKSCPVTFKKRSIMQSRGAYSRVAQSEQQDATTGQAPIRTRSVKRNNSGEELAETISIKYKHFYGVDIVSDLLLHRFFRILWKIVV